MTRSGVLSKYKRSLLASRAFRSVCRDCGQDCVSDFAAVVARFENRHAKECSGTVKK